MRSILTSKSIQNRWEKIAKDARRKIKRVDQINPKFSITHEETKKTPTFTPFTHEETQKTHEETQQSKVKESKVKKKMMMMIIIHHHQQNFLCQVRIGKKQPIKTLIDQLKTEDIFAEHCMRENSISTRDELNDYLERFKTHLIAIDETQKTLKDCKLHFMNWLRINKNIEANNGTTQNKYKTATKLNEPGAGDFL